MRWILLASAVVAVVAVFGPRAARAGSPACDAMAAAPAATGDAVAWALPIALALVDAEARLDLGAAARLSFVADAAAGAWYCADDDVVYVSAALVEWAWLGRAVDGRDFLGFVVAHELAHRRFDPGDAALGGTCPEIDLPREARADRRAAFLLATARDPLRLRGFSPFQLARHDGLASFFVAELGWPPACPALARRVAAVDEAIQRMAALGRRYDLGLTLALAGLDDGALALLGAVDRLGPAGREWDAVPELDLVAALVHLERAGRVGWCPDALARAPLDPSPCTLRCAPTLPRYPWLASRDALGLRAGSAVDRAAALATARALITTAVERGLHPARARPVLACAAYLEGAPDRALALADAAERPLFALQRLLLESPHPILSAPWQADLIDLARDLPPAGEARRAVSAWLGEPTADDRPPRPSRTPSLEAFVRLPPCDPAAPAPLTAGWTLADDGRCARLDHADGRHITVREAAPTGLAEDVAAWRALCELAPRGRTDDGVDVLGGRCPSWDGPGEGWLVFASRPVRAVRLDGLTP